MAISISQISSALRAEDIEGLIALGAPGDEYAREAQEISNALMSLNSVRQTADAIVAIVALVWAKSFNRSSEEINERMPAFRRIAQRLITP